MIPLLLYSIAVWALALVVWPVSWITALAGNSSLYRRLHAPNGLPEGGDRRIWIHAASVGESGIAFSLASLIHKKYPSARIFVSTITTTGLARITKVNDAAKDKPIDSIFLAPFDHPLVTSRFISRIAPTSFILVETEIWPWLILNLKQRNVPVTVVNGKIGRRSIRRYMIVKSLFSRLAEGLSLVCVQNRTFAKRYALLGVPYDHLEIIGNVKFDGLPMPGDFDRNTVRNDLGIDTEAYLLVAGSTRPGEEEIILSAYVKIRETIPGALLVLAPRHLTRLSEVEKKVHDSGCAYILRSSRHPLSGTGASVLILDTIGELVRTFAAADAAFVGGSFGDYGGHNPLEPASLGIPVLFGPYMEQTGSRELLSAGAALIVRNATELSEAACEIYVDHDKKSRMSTSGPAVVSRYRGTLERTVRHMIERGLL